MTKKIKVASLFSGIGGFETGIFQALGKDNVEVVFASEIDKYAQKAYEVIYGDKPKGDIMKVNENEIPDHDLLVGGFPCQDLSIAGNRTGISVRCEDCETKFEVEDDIFNSECKNCLSKRIVPATRSALFFEIARVARAKQPKVMLLENVKGLVSHNNGKTMDTVAKTLCNLGYKIDFQILNSKYFNVAQNRERVFIVAIKNQSLEEWDIDKKKNTLNEAKRRIQKIEGIKTFNFAFPSQENVKVSIRDILEQEVDERYYLSEEKTKEFVAKELMEGTDIKKVGYIKNDKNQNRVHITNGIMPTITANNQGGRRPGGLIAEINGLKQIGYIDKNAQGNRVYSIDGVSPTIASQTGGLGGSGGGVFAVENKKIKRELENEVRKIVSKTRPNTKISINFKENGDIRPHRNDPRKSGISELNINYEENQSFTVTSSHAPKIYGLSTKWRIRKLTPLECFRLQGFPDTYYETLKGVEISDSQLYKMAGNAVTTNVIESLVHNLKPYLS